MHNLYTSKVTQQGEIPAKILNDNKDLFSYFISESFNNAVNERIFPDKQTYAKNQTNLS